jgi:hypothetical protein
MAPAWIYSEVRIQKKVERSDSDGFTALNHVSSWIINADTKCGFLAAGSTLLGTAVLGSLKSQFAGLPFTGIRQGVAVIAVSVSALFVAGSITCLLLALIPRIGSPGRPCRFAFPYLADQAEDFVPSASAVDQRVEVWRQSRALARIARKKFTYFRFGLIFFGIALLTFAVGYMLVTAPQPARPVVSGAAGGAGAGP